LFSNRKQQLYFRIVSLFQTRPLSIRNNPYTLLNLKKKKNMEITHKTSLVPTILKTVPKSDDSDGLTSSYEKEKEQLGKYFINSSGGKSLKNAQPVAPLLLAHTKKI
jgi:hypothetical protein